MFENLNNTDLLIILGYFILVFVVAFRSSRTSGKSTKDYFLGSKNLGWFVIGASLFASNIGSEHLIGLAGQGASGDFVAGQFELLASLILLILGWVFVPFYIKTGVSTMPEFLEKRYDSWARGYLSWVSIIAYVLTKISVTIAAGGIVFTAILGIDFWTGAIIIVLATGLYTILGGLKAVAYTDLLQMFVLIGGSVAVTWFGLGEVGGWDGMVEKVSGEHLSLWRGLEDTNFPWAGILFGAPILGVWYWCTDQFIVQRVLAAKGLSDARKGTIFGGYLKLLPLFLFVLPGVIAFAMSVGPDPQLVFPIEDGKVQYDQALPALTLQVLPNGLKGLVVAGLLAALMSSLSSVFNSCSTLFTLDIYKKHRPHTSEKKLVEVGRYSTAVLVILGLAWIPLLRAIEGGLFQQLQSIQAYVSPPIAAVFLLGIFNKRLNAKGAKYSLLVGLLIGSLRMVLEIMSNIYMWELPELVSAFTTLNFLYFALLLFIICSVVLIAVSANSAAPQLAQVNEVTYTKGNFNWKEEKTNVFLSIGLVLCVFILWFVFR
ncbi:MAG: SSS family solute:Na+ symporter [Patiriisocius sp.]|jgi:SSS family solute:Na+ symporter